MRTSGRRTGGLAVALCLWAAVASAQVTRTYAAVPGSLGTIPRCGGAMQVSFPPADDFAIEEVDLGLTLVAGDARHLHISLSYGGRLFVGVPTAGSPVALDGTYTFSDRGGATYYQAVTSGAPVLAPGSYRVTDASGVPSSVDAAFAGEVGNTNRIQVELREDCAASGTAAVITGGTLTLRGTAAPPVRDQETLNGGLPVLDGGPGPQQPGPPRDLTFLVPPGRGVVQSVSVTLNIAHSWAGEVVATLEAPDGTVHPLFGYTGALGSGDGAGVGLGVLAGGYTFSDRATASWWAAADDPAAATTGVLPGSYRTSAPGGSAGGGVATSLDAAFAGRPAEGRWVLRVTDGGTRGLGYVYQSTLVVRTSVQPGPPTTVADAIATPFGTPVDGAVLTNDRNDAAGAMTAAIDTAAAHGRVSMGLSGQFTYTPDVGFTGVDTLSYRATNLVGTSAPTSVTIQVNPPRSAPPGTQITRVGAAPASALGAIPQGRWIAGGEASGLLCVGGGTTIAIPIADDLLVQDVRVRVSGRVSAVQRLFVTLTPPGSVPRDVLGGPRRDVAGIETALDGDYEFTDNAATDVWSAAALSPGTLQPGAYRGSSAGGAALTMTEGDQSSQGTWLVDLREYCHNGPAGSVDALALEITGFRYARVMADPGTTGPIPDSPGGPRQPGPPRDITFTVPPGRGVVRAVAVTMQVQHQAQGDVAAHLIAPDGTTHTLVSNAGATDAFPIGWHHLGADGIVTFSDRAPRTSWSTFFGQQSYRTTAPGGQTTVMDAAFAGTDAAGTWTLRVTDGTQTATGQIAAASLALVTSQLPDMPSNFRIARREGRHVTLRWAPPTLGPPPDTYVVSAGVAPGQTLVTLTTPDPVLDIGNVPAGVFHARVQAVSAGVSSGPSNELRLVVDVPEAPSAPANLRAVVDGQTVGLSWRPTHDGGEPTGLRLDVSGTASASIALPLLETVGFDGVPPGTFTLALRATAPAGISPPSNQVVIDVPRTCTAPPPTPIDFVVYATGGAAHLLWDPAPTGAAETSYLLTVGGAVDLTLPLTTRGISGAVPPGTYTFAVQATNSCGTSPPTATQTLVLP